MIDKMISQVAEFHDAFGVKRGNVDTQLRYDLFKEEFEEYKDAKNLVERADAIVDMLYIACGTLDLHDIKKFQVEYSPINADTENDCLIHIDILLDEYLDEENTELIENVILYILDLAYHNNILDILPELFQEVHESNLSKLDKNGKPIINELNSPYYDSRKPINKILKSDLFFEPKLKQILERNGKL